MKKLWNSLCQKIPLVWGYMWVVTITLLSVASIIAVIKLILKLFGVI